MADDIVTRLHAEALRPAIHEVCVAAASEIARLREINRNLHTECARMQAERDRLRAAEEARITNLRLLNETNAKLSRVRAAGDALAAAHFDDLCDCSDAECVAIIDAHAAWEEASRG